MQHLRIVGLRYEPFFYECAFSLFVSDETTDTGFSETCLTPGIEAEMLLMILRSTRRTLNFTFEFVHPPGKTDELTTNHQHIFLGIYFVEVFQGRHVVEVFGLSGHN